MERDEFRDFLLQINIPRESGRTLRFSLVRLLSRSISSKLTDEKYLSLRTVPFKDSYRFVVSSFTHSEYSRFKNDYFDQVDFLRFDPGEFRNITNVAFALGFELDEYMSSGRGKLEIRAPSSENRSEFLLMDMENRYHEGFKPYLIKLSGNGSKVRVRADFNFFLSRLGEKESYLIYDITEKVLKTHMETYENLSRFRSEPFRKHDTFYGLTPENIAMGRQVSFESVCIGLSEKFDTMRDRAPNQPPRIFLREKPSGRWIATVNVTGNTVQVIPGLDPTLESMLLIRQSIMELGD